MSREVVADSAALIGLSGIGQFSLLRSFPYQWALLSLPVQAVLRYSAVVDRALAGFVDLAAGVVFHRRLHGSEWSPNTVRWQPSATSQVAAGLSYPVARKLQVHLGVAFDAAYGGEGDVWDEGDVPRFVLLLLGLGADV